MNIFPESQLGIWLNTHIKYLEQTAEKNLRAAQNDPHWCRAANDETAFTDSAHALTTVAASTITRVPEAPVRSKYRVLTTSLRYRTALQFVSAIQKILHQAGSPFTLKTK